jgi:hypothetical protein
MWGCGARIGDVPKNENCLYLKPLKLKMHKSGRTYCPHFCYGGLTLRSLLSHFLHFAPADNSELEVPTFVTCAVISIIITKFKS